MSTQTGQQGLLETHDVGVVPRQDRVAVFPFHPYGVHSAYLLRLGTDMVQQGQDGFFVGYGDVESAQIGMLQQYVCQQIDVGYLKVEVFGWDAFLLEFL